MKFESFGKMGVILVPESFCNRIDRDVRKGHKLEYFRHTQLFIVVMNRIAKKFPENLLQFAFVCHLQISEQPQFR